MLLICILHLWLLVSPAAGACSVSTSLVQQPYLSDRYTGDGTYYGATGAGTCSYDASPNDLMVAALNLPQWANSAWCGACAEVSGPKGNIIVRIVDQCPECKTGDLDLSLEAFTQIANQIDGRVKISWRFVACGVRGPLQFRIKDGSSQWWSGLQVLNSPLPITKIEQLQGSTWVTMTQMYYNYHLMDKVAPGVGPWTVRVTAVTGQQVIQTGIPLTVMQILPGTVTFPVGLTSVGSVTMALATNKFTVSYSTNTQWCLRKMDTWMGTGALPTKADSSLFPVHATNATVCERTRTVDYPLTTVGSGFQCTGSAVVKVIAYTTLSPATGPGLTSALGNGTSSVLSTWWWPYFLFPCTTCGLKTKTPTPTSTATATLTNTATASTTGDPCLSFANSRNCKNVTVQIWTAFNANEDSWALYGQGCRTPLMGAPLQSLLDQRTYSRTMCLRPGAYRLVLLDNYGDGWGGGSYQVSRNVTIVVPRRTVNGTGAVETFTVAP